MWAWTRAWKVSERERNRQPHNNEQDVEKDDGQLLVKATYG
jgi:hypothetical protein